MKVVLHKMKLLRCMYCDFCTRQFGCYMTLSGGSLYEELMWFLDDVFSGRIGKKER